MKLNLGCGLNKLPGYVNVDKFAYCAPDQQFDLEVLPWPIADHAAEEVLFNHSLEHIGQLSHVFLGVMQELYRVCRHQARVEIHVPHPRHDHFLADPTHVRAITPMTMALFSKRLNRAWQAQGAANSPLGLYLDVDFELTRVVEVLDPYYQAQLANQTLTSEAVARLALERNNVISEYRISLQAIKPHGAVPGSAAA